MRQYGSRRHFPRRILILLVIIGLFALGGAVWVHRNYNDNLRPISSSTKEVNITIPDGSSSTEIAQQLYAAHLIRSSQTFEWYVNTHNIRDKLQAGTYTFSQSMSTGKIAEMIAAGKVATDLVTILPGQRLDQIHDTLIGAGFKSSDVDQALSAKQYRADYPALADNPASAGLEGFLYPDSYQLTATTHPSEIVAESLQEMQKHLTSDVRSGFAKRGLSVYQGVTLASIVEQEVPNAADRTKVAQVFLLRLKKSMPLQSDVARNYAKAIHDSRYDAYTHKGLPPGPIGTVSDTSLAAVAHPAGTDWLYFVAGDNGHTYFSHTLAEHEANVARYCQHKCSGN
jgi:UPF0755 protein